MSWCRLGDAMRGWSKRDATTHSSYALFLQVGMLGANAPDRVKRMWNIDIAGPLIYPTTSRWGHMIGAHYLKHLKNGDYPGSKLHGYLVNKTIAPEDSTRNFTAPPR